MIIHRIERCERCDRVVVEALEPMGKDFDVSGQTHCGPYRCITDLTPVPDETTLAGLRLGQRIDADVYRGGASDDEGVTRGSERVTKRGRVLMIDVIGTFSSVTLGFDDGDFQVAFVGALDGAKPGYPCTAFRLVPE